MKSAIKNGLFMWAVFCITLFIGYHFLKWLSQFDFWITLAVLLFIMLLVFILEAWLIGSTEKEKK